MRAFIPPSRVRDDGDRSHERGEEEEGDEDGLHLSCPACPPWGLAILSQADLESSREAETLYISIWISERRLSL